MMTLDKAAIYPSFKTPAIMLNVIILTCVVAAASPSFNWSKTGGLSLIGALVVWVGLQAILTGWFNKKNCAKRTVLQRSVLFVTGYIAFGFGLWNIDPTGAIRWGLNLDLVHALTPIVGLVAAIILAFVGLRVRLAETALFYDKRGQKYKSGDVIWTVPFEILPPASFFS